MELIHLSHCVYHCDYHVVITTKYRRSIFNKGVFSHFDIKLAEIVEHYPLLKIKEVNHDKDHMHLLISIPPTMAVGKAVGIIKQNTSKELKKKFPFIKEVYWGTESVWSGSYFVSTVGINENVIQQYIKRQGKKDLGQTLFKV